MYQITIEKVFAASHALRLPDGSYEPTHGHNWPVRITVGAEQLDAMDCVMDFHALERIVDDILAPFQSAHLNDVPPFSQDSRGINPSAERVAEHIGRCVAAKLPGHVALIEASVGEAPGCTAVYRG